MKLVHRLVGLILLLLLVVAATIVLRATVATERWVGMTSAIAGNRLMVAGSALALLCLLAVFLLSAMPVRKRERFLSFQGENGTVSISTDAISDYVSKLGVEFPSIVTMRPRVSPARHEVDIVIDCCVKAGPQIHEVCEVLQKRVREVMASGLGISQVRRVEVSVKEISSEHKPA